MSFPVRPLSLKLLPLTLLTCALLVLQGVFTLAESDAGPGRGPASNRPVLFFGVALDGYPLDASRMEKIHADLGLHPSMVVFFLQWPEHPEGGHFPWETLHVLDAFGVLPCLTWEPMFIHDGEEQVITAEQILGGAYDDYIRTFARSTRDYGRPLLIRFAHEMNLSRYHWGMRQEDYGPAAPDAYREMFRHVVRIFRQEHAENALFVFCPNAESVPHPVWSGDGAWNRASAYYPGHEYVDLVGLDGYNWGTTQTLAEHGWDSTFRGFAEIMRPMYEELRDLAPDKPLVVFETASAASGGEKSAWVRQAIRTMESWSVAGFVWFEANKEVDWRLAVRLDPGVLDFVRTRASRNAADVLGLFDGPAE